MGKAIINKHIDSSLSVDRNLFLKDIDDAKGEIIINNDANEPSIYIVNTNNEVVKITGSGGSGGGSNYDDTKLVAEINGLRGEIDVLQGKVEGDDKKSVREIATEVMGTSTPANEQDVIDLQSTLTGFTPENTVQNAINELVGTTSAHTTTLTELNAAISGNTETIGTLSALTATQGQNIADNASAITELSTTVSAHTATIDVLTGKGEGSIEKALDDTKAVIDAYTVNGYTISENPVLSSDDFTLSDKYTTINVPVENVVPGDVITTAISKLEVALANTTLALSAALNDIESRLGTPSFYDDLGNLHEATGLVARMEDVEKAVKQLEGYLFNPQQ